MKFKHTPPHNFYPRLLQAFAAALMGGAFYMGAYTFTYGGAAPTLDILYTERYNGEYRKKGGVYG